MNKEQKFILDVLVQQLILIAMEQQKLSVEESMFLIYNSQLYEKIMDLDTGLYIQSPSYNYELLKHEIKYGKIL